MNLKWIFLPSFWDVTSFTKPDILANTAVSQCYVHPPDLTRSSIYTMHFTYISVSMLWPICPTCTFFCLNFVRSLLADLQEVSCIYTLSFYNCKCFLSVLGSDGCVYKFNWQSHYSVHQAMIMKADVFQNTDTNCISVAPTHQVTNMVLCLSGIGSSFS